MNIKSFENDENKDFVCLNEDLRFDLTADSLQTIIDCRDVNITEPAMPICTMYKSLHMYIVHVQEKRADGF